MLWQLAHSGRLLALRIAGTLEIKVYTMGPVFWVAPLIRCRTWQTRVYDSPSKASDCSFRESLILCLRHNNMLLKNPPRQVLVQRQPSCWVCIYHRHAFPTSYLRIVGPHLAWPAAGGLPNRMFLCVAVKACIVDQKHIPRPYISYSDMSLHTYLYLPT